MKIFKIAEKEYRVPESWDEVTLEQFVEAYADLRKEDQTKRDKVRFVLDLFGLEYREFCRLSTDDQLRIIDAARFALEDLPAAKDDPGFEFEGVRYTVPANWGEVSVAEWLDVDHYLNALGPIRGIPHFLAIYFRPADRKEYDSEGASQLAEKFKSMKITAAWGAANFFSKRAQSLSKMSNAYSKLEDEARKATERARLLVKNGAGLGFFARLRGKMLLKLIEF